MEQITSTAGIAQETRLAVAPVFLLTGIAVFLTVLSNRLGRVIDRTHAFEAAGTSGGDAEPAPAPDGASLRQRVWLIQWAIRLFVGSALLIPAAPAADP